MRKFVLSVVLLIALVGSFYLLQKQSDYQLPRSQIKPEELYAGVSYEGISDKYKVNLLSDKLVSPTRIRITPDNQHLLVSQITGEVLGFDRVGSGWSDVPYLVTWVETRFPGFPPDEAGLAGISLSPDFAKNGKLFFLYTYKDKGGTTQNRVSLAIIKEKSGKLVGDKPKLIYQANIAGAGSHQITDGVGISINNKPHLMFLIGEGFKSERAQDPQVEGGKVMLIQEDGSNPLGNRPYANPKVEALGIRNAFVITNNPSDSGKYLIADTGPDKYDRLIYTHLTTGSRLNFNWSGDQEKLKEPIPDPDNRLIKDLVIYRLPQTRTFTGLKFIPKSNQVLAVMFGQTGSTANTPGKEVWLGELTNLNGQPKIFFTPIIRRVKEAEGKLGNPLGLEIDPQTGDFFFADILEGRLYQVSGKGGE